MVDARRLSLMRRTAFVINTSRGEVVDETALEQALRDGTIGGAALDVFETEPPRSKIAAAPNMIASPHMAGQTKDAQASSVAIVGAKLNQFFSGRLQQ
jgi:D-3-phosphoglycerate dehydrogenase